MFVGRRRLLSPSCLAFGLVVTCSACEPATVDLEVRGVITAADSGDPLPGASVSLLWTHDVYSVEAVGTESGPDGTYVLKVLDLPCDAPLLAVALDPYEPQSRDLSCSEAEQRQDFALRR